MKRFKKRTMLLAIASLVIVLLLAGCGKKNSVIDDGGNPNPGGGGTKITAPVLGAVSLTEITNVAAKITVPITSNGEATITEAGITINDVRIKSPDAIGAEIKFSLERLTPNTPYKIKGYAVNSAGTSYSVEVLLKTLNILVGHNGVKDFDGNQYDTVRIGNQVWMAENLKVKHYRDGSPISIVDKRFDGAYWRDIKSGAMCYYNNDTTIYSVYGGLYNQKAVLDARGLAPAGWHVPSASEWEELIIYLGGEYVAPIEIRETGTTHWLDPNDATNGSGFTAFGGGMRSGGGDFGALKWLGYWWSATDLTFVSVENYKSRIKTRLMSGQLGGQSGLSVRCLKDK